MPTKKKRGKISAKKRIARIDAAVAVQRKVLPLRAARPAQKTAPLPAFKPVPVAPAPDVAVPGAVVSLSEQVTRIPPATSLPPKTAINTIQYTVSLRTTGNTLSPYFSWKSYDPHPEMFDPDL